MSDLLFSDYGIEVLQRNGRLFVRYDRGEIVVDFAEAEITPTQFERLKQSEDAAYRVLLEVQAQQE